MPLALDQIPAPPGTWPLGHTAHWAGDTIPFLEGCRDSLGDVFRLDILGQPQVVLLHPEAVRQVLVEKAAQLSKGTAGYARLREVLGDGLLTADGDLWHRQRRLMQPFFNRGSLAAYVPALVAAADRLVQRWADRGDPVDLPAEMSTLTMDAVCAALLGSALPGDARELVEAATSNQRETIHRVLSPLRLPRWLPTARTRAFFESMDRLEAVVARLVGNHRDGAHGETLLSRLVLATDEETGTGMDDAQLRDEVLTLFLAGHETTAYALAFTLILLAEHPEVEARLVEDLAGVTAGPDVLQQVPLLRMVILESLRLYPPAFHITRAVAEPVEIAGHHLEPPTTLLVCQYLTHRHPEAWVDPERFDPERWRDPATEAELEKAGAYFPFGLGRRQCIGKHFAMLELGLILARLLPAYEVRPVEDGIPALECNVTMRPKGAFRVHVRPR